MGLTPDQIQGLLAKKRVKGLYEEKLTFLYSDSDEAGVDVKEQWPVEFGQKSATTLYQGFSNAAKKLDLEDAVDVINRDGHVFILVTTRANLVIAEQAATNGDKPVEAVEDNANDSDTTELV
jgi:hypothetical protein